MNVLAQQDSGWTQPLQDGLSTIIRIIPNLIAFLAILIIGYLIAKAIAKALNAILERVGFDRAVERGGVRTALAKTEYDASDIVAKLIFYTLFLFVLQMAFGVFGPNPINDLLFGVISYLPQVIAALIIIVIAAAIAKAVRDILSATLGGLSYGSTLATAASIAILVIGVFAALDTLEIAPRIVNGLFFAILAVLAGSAIIAIGGGGIHPMRERWEAALERYDEEKHRVRAEVRSDDQQSDETYRSGAGAQPLTTESGTTEPRTGAREDRTITMPEEQRTFPRR